MKRHAHTYAELARVGRRYYNDTNFCGVVAVAVAGKVAFGKARSILMKHAEPVDLRVNDERIGYERKVSNLGRGRRQHRAGTYVGLQIAAGEILGYSVKQIKAPALTLGKCIKQLPKQGVYWVWTTRHITAIQDGEVMDWADDSRRHKVIAVFQITRHFEEV